MGVLETNRADAPLLHMALGGPLVTQPAVGQCQQIVHAVGVGLQLEYAAQIADGGFVLAACRCRTGQAMQGSGGLRSQRRGGLEEVVGGLRTTVRSAELVVRSIKRTI